MSDDSIDVGICERRAERRRAIDLAELCIAAGRPELIPELLRSDASPAEARRRLGVAPAAEAGDFASMARQQWARTGTTAA